MQSILTGQSHIVSELTNRLNVLLARLKLTDIIDLNTQQAVKAFKELVLNRRNPDLDEFEMLDIFRNRGLKDTADYLHSLL